MKIQTMGYNISAKIEMDDFIRLKIFDDADISGSIHLLYYEEVEALTKMLLKLIKKVNKNRKDRGY